MPEMRLATGCSKNCFAPSSEVTPRPSKKLWPNREPADGCFGAASHLSKFAGRDAGGCDVADGGVHNFYGGDGLAVGEWVVVCSGGDVDLAEVWGLG